MWFLIQKICMEDAQVINVIEGPMEIWLFYVPS